MTVDLSGTEVTGKELEHRLDEVYITAQQEHYSNDPNSPFVTSGVRIGTAGGNHRGFGEDEMKQIAGFISDCVFKFDEKRDEIQRCKSLTARFPIY